MEQKPEADPIVKTGVAVIICKDKKVLVGQRAGSHGHGCWAFPGGHIEMTDGSLKECGEREVHEETGIICNIYSPDKYREELFTTYDILSEDGKKRYVTPYLIADYIAGGTIVKCGEDTNAGRRDYEKIASCDDKCNGWYWKTLDELIQLVKAEKNKSWIPINQVIFYLNQMWNLK
jgi:8-oxo-dGTP diphosphatase